MKDVANIFKLSPKDLQKKSKYLWDDTAPEIVDFANDLQNFLQDVDTPYVIGLDGGYGTGKTHFSTRFAVQMHKKIRTLYFSAWENDYKNDPLSIFVEQIALLVKQEQKVIKPKTFQFIQNLLGAWAKSTDINVSAQVGELSAGITTNVGDFISNLKKLELPVDVLQKAKSENIIADTLARMHVPYRYEYPLEMTAERGQKITINPDFMCLNLKTREEFFWEHFGMMDNPECSERTVQKLSLYAKNGFFPGKNLIITTETVACPINTKLIEKIVELYLKRDID